MLKHGSLWEEIFEARSYFWPYDSFGQSVGDKYRKIMDLSVLVVKMFWGSGLVSVSNPHSNTDFCARDVITTPLLDSWE
jgi:hypothetical protein